MAENSGDIVQTTIRLDAETHRSLRMAVVERRYKSIQAAVDEALTAWLGEAEEKRRQGIAHPSTDVLVSVPKQHKAVVTGLIGTLRNADKEITRQAKELCKVLAWAAEARRGRRRGSAPDNGLVH